MGRSVRSFAIRAVFRGWEHARVRWRGGGRRESKGGVGDMRAQLRKVVKVVSCIGIRHAIYQGVRDP